jgi:hypothetical protein
MIDRRTFNKKTLLWLSLAATTPFTMTGCNIMQDIVNWEPDGLAAFNGIVTALGEFGVVLGPEDLLIVAAVRTLMNNLYTDAKTYLALNPPPATEIAKIEEVLSLISGNIQQFLTQVQVTGGTIISLILAIAQMILSTIGGFISGLPTTAAVTASNRVSVRLGSFSAVTGNLLVGQGQNQGQLTFVAERRNLKQFRSGYNSICQVYGRGELELY